MKKRRCGTRWTGGMGEEEEVEEEEEKTDDDWDPTDLGDDTLEKEDGEDEEDGNRSPLKEI